ncbi:hypothetical protein SAMN06265349_10637 [Flavobacterium resistens]|uniref:Uncharacterized protein n=1 Tax=Flavobacterium resistens TaxID=443612 RepID=A0A521EZP0_9FLAO|nr:hypothetical protein SAMN06265349_10637 [Flavobacterium resistens]
MKPREYFKDGLIFFMINRLLNDPKLDTIFSIFI